MEELGDDLEKYLNELDDKVFDDEVHDRYGKKEAPKKQQFKPVSGEPVWMPFWEIFKGAGELVTAIIPIPSGKKKSSGVSYDMSASKSAAKGASGGMYQAYKNYKKSHQLLAW
jgi:hypothetical protein